MNTRRAVSLALVLAACGGEAPSLPPVEEGAALGRPSLEEPVAPALSDEEPNLRTTGGHLAPFVSRFGPSQGLVGTQISILGVWPLDLSTMRVTIGGVDAALLDNPHVLTAVVQPGTVTGELCVWAHLSKTCVGTFTVLTGPVLYSVSPSEILVDSADVTIHAYGDGISPDSTLAYGRCATPLEVTARTEHEIVAMVPAELLQFASEQWLFVYTPSSGSRSESISITVVNPGPAIDSLAPSHFPASDAPVITLTGQGFVWAAVVLLDNVDLATTWISPTELQVQISADIASGEHTLSVRNPAPGGGVSAPQHFTVR